MNTLQTLAPQRPRFDSIDALRGFAIASILLLHFIEHFLYFIYPSPGSETEALLNVAVADCLRFLFAGKSYTIFALLFGFTYALQQMNAEKRGGDFAGRFAWRLLLLMGFSMLNAAFYPSGDMLKIFAITGLVMIPFRRCSAKVLLLVSLVFLIQPIEILQCFGVTIESFHCEDHLELYTTPAIATGNFWQMALCNMTHGQLGGFGWFYNAGRVVQAPGLFLLGMAIARGGYFSKGMDFWVKVFVSVFFLSCLLYFASSAASAELKIILNLWYNLAFAAMIVSIFVIFYESAAFQKMTACLRSYGRMSLTNYISQSIIASLILFPYGFNLAPQLGVAWSFVVAIGVMVFQILLSCWWLSRFKQGPLEALWRKLTWIAQKKAS